MTIQDIKAAQAFAPRRRPDYAGLVAGVVVILASVVFGVMALGYGIGSVRMMGAGFFPLLLSVIGALLGTVVVVKAVLLPEVRHGDEPDARRLLLVCAAFLVFALGIEPLGLLLTISITTFVASLAHRDAKIRDSVILGVVLALALWILFVVLLKLPIPVWPGQR